VVDGSDSFRNVGRLPSLCLRNTEIDVVQNTKLAKISADPRRSKGKSAGSRPHSVSEIVYSKLVADPRERLGINGVEEIKAHPFFAGIQWSKLR
jgi:hypothetical protein